MAGRERLFQLVAAPAIALLLLYITLPLQIIGGEPVQLPQWSSAHLVIVAALAFLFTLLLAYKLHLLKKAALKAVLIALPLAVTCYLLSKVMSQLLGMDPVLCTITLTYTANTLVTLSLARSKR